MRKTHIVKQKIRGRPRRGGVFVSLKEIGKRIRSLRGKENQTEFAGRLGVSQGQLSRYEKGAAAPSLDSLVRLKNKSGKSIDWIITGKG
jgi:transcriptional regulator with XRE-family HTH domain